jgi:solute carrier family 35 (UDP-xylose/UDP-N-acetylglucosamine transporter), member B4
MINGSDVLQGKVAGGHDSASTFGTGLVILFVAQVLSAIMGIYVEVTYERYGRHWQENMFYTHVLSLPLFLPFAPALIRQFNRLAHSPALALPSFMEQYVLPNVGGAVRNKLKQIYLPSQLVYMVLNVLTQYACIRGVNLLAAATSALTVTIVLNIRKLVSLLLSIWLFGNQLAGGTLFGAVLVFTAGGIYGLHENKGRSLASRQKTVAAVAAGKTG